VDAELQPDRARRLDRTSRLSALVCARALGSERTGGIIVGQAFGAVDATAAFMRRLREKGPRFVNPAEFPSLVPSSPAGHVSIYLGLGGPALVVADLAASGECAFAQAFELVAAGDVDRMCAVAVEERSAIVEQIFSVLFRNGDRRGSIARREGAAAIALAASDGASEGEDALAEIVTVDTWNDGRRSLAPLEVPSEEAIVVLAGSREEPSASESIVEASAWRSCRRIHCADACGTHEAVGGMAIAVAVAHLARGDAKAALAVGSARGSGYAVSLRPWATRRSD
jgi:3-oxoacyl-[acyl-carrier-protein] synthase II